eukprot:TRINITY_DN3122_c0_g1_i5.p3 TRINITY_DN3122_c0_g1~~TRINITY_DN3122_c0_g1_i5.p3  ORF type:complete len:104 (+),score=7.81 TRINITY_DN3122_c0_g1_i5:84-395(+)
MQRTSPQLQEKTEKDNTSELTTPQRYNERMQRLGHLLQRPNKKTSLYGVTFAIARSSRAVHGVPGSSDGCLKESLIRVGNNAAGVAAARNDASAFVRLSPCKV